MSNIQIFNYQSNEVRTVEMGGEPWFVLKDVCTVLGISHITDTAKRMDEDEVGQTEVIDSMGRKQSTYIINESGLYNVILRSDKPEAKPFRKWVTSEVLPSIRKNGGYIAGQEQLTPEELMAKALLVANKTLADREARICELTAQNSQLTVEKQIMQPKAEYFDELVDRNLLTNFRETARSWASSPKPLWHGCWKRNSFTVTRKASCCPERTRTAACSRSRKPRTTRPSGVAYRRLSLPKAERRSGCCTCN